MTKTLDLTTVAVMVIATIALMVAVFATTLNVSANECPLDGVITGDCA